MEKQIIEWSESNPQYSGYYLTSNNNGAVYYAYYNKELGGWYVPYGNGNQTVDNVTYWTNIPQGPSHN